MCDPDGPIEADPPFTLEAEQIRRVQDLSRIKGSREVPLENVGGLLDKSLAQPGGENEPHLPQTVMPPPQNGNTGSIEQVRKGRRPDWVRIMQQRKPKALIAHPLGVAQRTLIGTLDTPLGYHRVCVWRWPLERDP